MTTLHSSPRADGFHMPAEWAAQTQTWMIWPERPDNWRLGGKPAPVIDGMTGDQRFFLGWAQIWRRNVREAAARQRLLTDPHAPDPYRADIVRNFDQWYEAFKPAPDGKLVLKPEDRVKIW